jgi:hypothetical protein
MDHLGMKDLGDDLEAVRVANAEHPQGGMI